MTFGMIILTILSSAALYGCTPDKGAHPTPPKPPLEIPDSPDGPPNTENNGDAEDNNDNAENDNQHEKPPQTTLKMKILSAQASFTATLSDNPTAAKFRAILPLTLSMNDMNNNEKYAILPSSLPALQYNPHTIQNGDIMLYGSSTLVLFYKTFSTSYSYTPIATIDNPQRLQQTLGQGNISLKFELDGD